jgi:hypothetical protein
MGGVSRRRDGRILFTASTVLVVVAQVRVSSAVRGLGDLPRISTRATATIIAAAAAYLVAHYLGEVAAIVLLAAGLVLHTATEMLTSAGEWLVSIELADDEHRGKYLSVFSLGGLAVGRTRPDDRHIAAAARPGVALARAGSADLYRHSGQRDGRPSRSDPRAGGSLRGFRAVF